jgi:hypothetical protein
LCIERPPRGTKAALGAAVHQRSQAADFSEETPTVPRQSEAHELSQRPEARGARGAGGPEAQEGGPASAVAPVAPAALVPLAPLDAVPVLAVPREEVPWRELGDLSTQLLLRVDGATCAMDLVTGTDVVPVEGARELASLASRGLLRLEPPRERATTELDLDIAHDLLEG